MTATGASEFAWVFAILLILGTMSFPNSVCAQPTQAGGKLPSQNHFNSYSDTIPLSTDSLLILANRLIGYNESSLRERFARPSDSALLAKVKKQLGIDSSSLAELKRPFESLLTARPLVRPTSGFISYQANYRSNIDTPFAEKNINQHNILARLNLSVGVAPVSITYWGRLSNSSFYRDIHDVQVSFDAATFANNLQTAVKEKLTQLSPHLIDSAAAALLAIKDRELGQLKNWLNKPLHMQKVIEASEVVNVPKITYKSALTPEANAQRADTLKSIAGKLLTLYKAINEQYHRIAGEVDSLRSVYQTSVAKAQRFKQLVSGTRINAASLRSFEKELEEYGFSEATIPAKYRWLLGVRKLNIGRSVLNQSELTAKNIGINGINFEYNSWYFVGVTAGMIDYRFRDFVVNPSNKSPQWLYMLRLGIGNIEGNHIILSGFRGQKQLFTGSSNRGGQSSFTTSGYSLQARVNLGKTSWILGEYAESVSPDIRTTPAGESSKIGLSDNSNNAYSVNLFSYLARFRTRLEGMYKYQGANFQSFNSYQNNARQESWYLKADQSFFKNQLRFNASVRKNDFVNPFVVQAYSSNTVFKAVSATFKRRNWPVLTAGYLPMTQYSKLGEQVMESRFQSLNASYFHQYKLFRSRAATSFIYNRFLNSQGDTAFIYYNATNISGSQQFFFEKFSIGITAAYTDNGSYNLLVLDEKLNWNFERWGTLGFGASINRFNAEILKLGGYVSANWNISPRDVITVSFETGWLPSYNGNFSKNETGMLHYTRAFNFTKHK